jgi:hypothetical protein
MVQYITHSPQAAVDETLRSNLAKTFNQANEFAIERQQYERNRGRLQEALSSINQNDNFMDQFKKIGPTLLSTPGGAQALGEILPTLVQAGQNKAVQDNLRNRNNQNAPNQNVPQRQEAIQPGQPGYNPNQPSPLLQNEPYSPYNTFPERSAGPTPTPLRSPAQTKEDILDLMQRSGEFGKPLDYAQAANIIQNEENQKIASNAQIQQEKDRIQEAQKELTGNIVRRAQAEGFVKDPSDVPVVEKLALQAKNLPSEVEAWNYVKEGLRKYDTARANINRVTLPNKILNFNDYQSKEKALNSIQKDIQVYKDLNLIPELRNVLTEGPGFGPADIEGAIFPLSSQEKSQLNKFPENPNKGKVHGFLEPKFPSTESKMTADNFARFKDSLRGYLLENPGANLVTTRSLLTEGKGYDWHDFADAYNELVNEGAVKPTDAQYQQNAIINNAPLPGLGAFFNFTIKGTK